MLICQILLGGGMGSLQAYSLQRSRFFVYRNLSVVIFVQVSQDDKIFAEIASAEAGLYKALSKK